MLTKHTMHRAAKKAAQYVRPLASIRKEKSFENLKFQSKTQQETEKINIIQI